MAAASFLLGIKITLSNGLAKMSAEQTQKLMYNNNI